MREILFRGKRIDNGKWVYGYYVYTKDSNGEYQHFIVTPKWFIVDPSTVGQYTGLTDKNGKRIFEGDIIGDGGFVGIVVFDDNDDGAFLVKDPADPADSADGEFFSSLIDREVCGNIHDNPDLLDVEE